MSGYPYSGQNPYAKPGQNPYSNPGQPNPYANPGQQNPYSNPGQPNPYANPGQNPYANPGQNQYPYTQGSQQGAPPGINPQVHQWFTTVDTDRSGKITAKELKQALVNGNSSHFSEEACGMMIAMFDRDNTGTIDVQEFQGLWDYIHQWKGVYERYDADRTGQIELPELQKALSDMGYRLSPNFVSDTLAKFDRTHRRSLAFDNFIVFCVQLKLITDAFRARDNDRSGSINIGYEDFLSVAILHRQ